MPNDNSVFRSNCFELILDLITLHQFSDLFCIMLIYEECDFSVFIPRNCTIKAVGGIEKFFSKIFKIHKNAQIISCVRFYTTLMRDSSTDRLFQQKQFSQWCLKMVFWTTLFAKNFSQSEIVHEKCQSLKIFWAKPNLLKARSDNNFSQY